MDNEQLNSNLNQLIINQDEIVKNQIEICEVIKDLTKQVKKIRKPKKESNYDLNNIFGNPVEQLDKITFKQDEVKKNWENIEEIKIKFKELELRKQANDLVDKFMPLVNQWDETKPKYNECYQGAINEPIIGVWYYSKQNQRKAAIKCAIRHCEIVLNDQKLAFPDWIYNSSKIKSELQKMLSE